MLDRDEKGLPNEEKGPLVLAIPYLHPKVDLADLRENGLLVTDEELAAVKLNNLPQGRSSVNYKGNIFEVVRRDDVYYKVYKPDDKSKELGEGSFGRVILGQNLNTGKVTVIKESRPLQGWTDRDHIAMVVNEKKALKITQQYQGSYLRPVYDEKKRAIVQQAEIIMDLAEGPTLESIVRSKRQMPTVRWLDVCVGALTSFSELHKKGLIHRDIKPANVTCDVLNRSVTPVDLGIALICDPKKLSAMGGLGGTPFFIAPEVEHLPVGEMHEYTGKEDVYSAGKTIANLLGLTRGVGKDPDDPRFPQHLVLASRNHEQFIHNQQISNPKIRALILAYLSRMTHLDPNKRPTMEEAKQFFEVVKDFHLDLMSKISKVGFLNIEEYAKAEANDKKEMVRALEAADEVCLLDKNGENKQNYLQIKRELEKKGLNVRRDVVQHDGNNLAEKIGAYIDRKSAEERMAHNGFFVGKNPDPVLQANLRKKQIVPVAIDSKKDYRREIRSSIGKLHVSPQHFYILIKNLEDDIARLERKYKEPRNPDVQSRIELLKSENGALKELKNKNELSYGALSQRLNALQNKLIATSPLKQLLEQNTSYVSLTSRQTILDTIKTIQRDVPGFKR